MKKPNWFISALFGSNPDRWEDWKHRATNYQYWTPPYCEMVTVPKCRIRIDPAASIPFPEARAVLSDGSIRVVAMADLEATAGNVTGASPEGVGGGRPMQEGTEIMRRLSWGYREWGQRNETEIPMPKSGWYWSEGYPNPYFDRHCAVVAPNGEVHEMIQLDPNAPFGSSLVNQALGWGKWRDQELIDGRPVTAVGAPMHPYVWTPWSRQDPHRLSLVVGDYVGADGTLSEGLPAGAVVMLDNASPSYFAMRSLGGECAAVAEALVTYGALVIDRNGYTDVAGNAKTGTTMSKPALHVQPSRHWVGSNIRSLKIRLGDFRIITGTGPSYYIDTYMDSYDGND